MAAAVASVFGRVVPRLSTFYVMKPRIVIVGGFEQRIMDAFLPGSPPTPVTDRSKDMYERLPAQ